MNSSLATAVADFLAHKRALGRKYQTEEATLRLLLVFTSQHGAVDLHQLTPCLLDAFIASRPRPRARSFNHLVGILGCFLDWAVTQQRLEASPLRRTRRHETDRRLPFLFDASQARRLLDAAAALPDNPRATGRGPAYHAIFALCYGLGLRAGEACGLRLGDIDTSRQLLVVRGGKFGKSRLVPHGPRLGELLACQAERRGGGGEDPLFSFDGRRSVHPCTASQVVPPARHRARLPGPRRRLPAPSSLPAALVRGGMPGALVPGGRRPADAALPAFDLHGPRRPCIHRRLPDHHAATARRGQPALRGLRRTGVVGGEAMTGRRPLGPLVQSFFLDHLVAVKGLRPASVRSYRDTIRLLLCFTAEDKGTKITKLSIEDLSFERILGFLRYLEDDRANHARTRNQRLAALHTLFDYIASREPEMLGVCQQVAAIPMKRAAPAETHFLERDEIEALFRHLPRAGRLALRDRALLLFLYNTGARVQEAADLRAGHLELGEAAVARLHGKGDKWRTCPLWRQTAALLAELLGSPDAPPAAAEAPVFRSATGEALTRFGIYKIVRRHAGHLDDTRARRRISPHIFRHTAAVHLLEAGVEVNVIRGWLGHADLTTTNRYAEINTKAKIEALRNTEPPGTSAGPRPRPVWRSDEALLNWLSSL